MSKAGYAGYAEKKEERDKKYRNKKADLKQDRLAKAAKRRMERQKKKDDYTNKRKSVGY
jgi:hypothetical protein